MGKVIDIVRDANIDDAPEAPPSAFYADWLQRNRRDDDDGSSGAPAMVSDAPPNAVKVCWEDLPKLPNMWKPVPPDPSKFPGGTPGAARVRRYERTECVGQAIAA